MSRRVLINRVPTSTQAAPRGSLAPDPAPLAAGTPFANGLAPARASTAGFVLIDSAQNPVAFNAEAVHILCYPDKPAIIVHLGAFLAGRIRSKLLTGPSHDQRPSFVTGFKSGRRLYFCRVFELSPTSGGSSPPSLALLLERGSSEVMSMSEVAKQFNLSPREQEAVKYLLTGLTSKEIANRMKISTNTVKAFLRLIMVKMGVSTRSGILGKIMTAKPSLYSGAAPASSK
jgi:DNA-binding CsgD family transcriptional regulator